MILNLKHIHLYIFICSFALVSGPALVLATNSIELDRQAHNGLKELYISHPAAEHMAEKAKGILVFPNVVKGGFVLGGQYGEGTLLKGGQTIGHYNTASASFGLQSGKQSYGYVMFFMNNQALDYLKQGSGWKVGVGPRVKVVQEGPLNDITDADVYVFFYGNQGLMAKTIEGSKITPLSINE